MPKRKTEVIERFGERLAQLRKAGGYTQVEFAAEVGMMQRTFIEREKLKARVRAQAAA